MKDKIFEDSIFNCLQGDNDEHINHFVFENNLSRELSQKKQGANNKIITSEVKQEEYIIDQEDTQTMSLGSQKSKFQYQEIPSQYIESQNIKQNYHNATQVENKNGIDRNQSLVKNQLQDNQNNQNTSLKALPNNLGQQLQNLRTFKNNHINHQLSCKSAQNYEKAANIVRSVLKKKSMSRVERINKHVLNFIQFLKWRKKNRRLQCLQQVEKKKQSKILLFTNKMKLKEVQAQQDSSSFKIFWALSLFFHFLCQLIL
ncbi:hypothetical protein ABPG72_020204 [Tetrahymena utriculariae]